MRIIINGQATRGTMSNIINGIPVYDESGGGGVGGFWSVVSEPPDITPELPDDLRLTFDAALPEHVLHERPDSTTATVKAGLLWGVYLPEHILHEIPEHLPIADVDDLASDLPDNQLPVYYDLPVEDVDDLSSSLPAPVM